MGFYLRQAFGSDRDETRWLGDYQLQVHTADHLNAYMHLQSCVNDAHACEGSITDVQVTPWTHQKRK